MTETTIKINGNTYDFENESFSNSRNWGHKTRLYKNSHLVSEAKRIYLNRTWEVYQYQSCMRDAVYKLITEAETKAIERYKSSNNIKRLSKERREKVLAECKNENKELYTLIEKL